MSEYFSRGDHRDRSRLSGAAAEAVDDACSRQLELVQDRLRYDKRATVDECREAAEDWHVDECLILDMDLDDRLSLLEDYAADYGLELGAITLEDLRSRIETLTAMIVGYLGEEHARDAFRQIEELLDEKDLPFDNLLSDNPYELFRHYAERDEPPWHVYEYRNLEGGGSRGKHVDLYELTVAGISFYVRQQLERGTLSAEEETWEAN
jgi:hypothetical protein